MKNIFLKSIRELEVLGNEEEYKEFKPYQSRKIIVYKPIKKDELGLPKKKNGDKI